MVGKMAFIDDSFNPRVRDSFNTTTNTNSGNQASFTPVNVSDNAINFGSGNGNGNTDSSGSGNHSGNGSDNTLNSYNDNSDHSMNDTSDNSSNGSGNVTNVTWTDDHAISAGDRAYNTGFGGLDGGAYGAGNIDARSTVVDQSVNQSITSLGGHDGGHPGVYGEGEGGWGGGVSTSSHSSAVVASGDGSIAAGDDFRVDNSVDNSTHIGAGGDVNLGNTSNVNTVWGSYNTHDDHSTTTDNSMTADVENSFNAYHTDVDVNGSFNHEVNNVNVNDWNVDANVIWGSTGAGIADHDIIHG